jgi:hypothetical protein
MPLDNEAKSRILELVSQRPQSIQELAVGIGVSWKTADRYVEALCENEGVIGVHTFRKGTQGALKVVFPTVSSAARSTSQEWILRRLESGKRKDDFSPLDIFQYVSPERKRVRVIEYPADPKIVFSEFIAPLSSAQEQVLVFSGNLSWVGGKKGREAQEVLGELLDRGVAVKILSRVEIPSLRNLDAVYRLAGAAHAQQLEIRHMEQPLRGFVIDDARVLLRETKRPESYRPGELDAAFSAVYEWSDPKWVSFTEKVFWQYWQNGFDAKKRLSNLQ